MALEGYFRVEERLSPWIRSMNVQQMQSPPIKSSSSYSGGLRCPLPQVVSPPTYFIRLVGDTSKVLSSSYIYRIFIHIFILVRTRIIYWPVLKEDLIGSFRGPSCRSSWVIFTGRRSTHYGALLWS